MPNVNKPINMHKQMAMGMKKGGAVKSDNDADDAPKMKKGGSVKAKGKKSCK